MKPVVFHPTNKDSNFSPNGGFGDCLFYHRYIKFRACLASFCLGLFATRISLGCPTIRFDDSTTSPCRCSFTCTIARWNRFTFFVCTRTWRRLLFNFHFWDIESTYLEMGTAQLLLVVPQQYVKVIECQFLLVLKTSSSEHGVNQLVHLVRSH